MGAPKKYQHAIKQGCPYEGIYGASYWTIKKWAAKKYPLDNVEETKALIASQQNQPRGEAPGHAPQQPVAADRRENGPKTHDVARTASLGLSAAIDRLKQAEAAAHAEMLNAPTPAEKVAASKRWTLIVKELRDTEKSNPEIEESNKQTLRAADVKQTLSELFVRMRQDLESLPKRIALELIGKDELAIREILATEVGRIINAAHSCKYLEQE